MELRQTNPAVFCPNFCLTESMSMTLLLSLDFGVSCYIAIITGTYFGIGSQMLPKLLNWAWAEGGRAWREETWLASRKLSVRTLRKLRKMLEAGGKDSGDLYHIFVYNKGHLAKFLLLSYGKLKMYLMNLDIRLKKTSRQLL